MNFECDHCGALFKIEHKLDEHYYEVYFCPFCGGEISEGREIDMSNELDVQEKTFY